MEPTLNPKSLALHEMQKKKNKIEE